MATVQATLKRPVTRMALLVGALAGLSVLSAAGGRKADPAAPRKGLVALFARTETAKNPVRLHLFVDRDKVLGWVGGRADDYAGSRVTIRSGDKAEMATVGKDGTFTWKYRVAQPTRAAFTVFHAHRPDLRQSVQLLPPATPPPSVFFVIDRTVYRPGHALHFAGFLRKLDDRAEFVPVVNQAVEVRITSEKKKTVAGKLRLTSDDFGRITGAYTFTEADALDNYELSVAGYKGTARVSLAEFRKSKIKLKIAGAVEAGKLKLKFEALDFLEKPVGGARVHFTAQVVRRGESAKKYSLKPEEFVYHEPESAQSLDLDELPEDELLLWECGMTPLAGYRAPSGTVVAELDGDVSLQKKEPGEHAIDLKEEWLKGGYAVTVQGILIDQNGHEQRAVHTVPLSHQARTLTVATAKRYYAANEPIRVTARVVDDKGKPVPGTATLVAMRLAPAQPVVRYDWRYANNFNSIRWHSNRLMQISSLPRHRLLRANRWEAVEAEDVFQRTLVNAVPFQGDTAAVKLARPGAYKLVVVTNFEDGTKLEKEVGCVVRQPDDLPGLILKLDKEEYAAGDVLTGAIHSRYAGARVLLTVRDSTGIRFWKPIQFEGSAAELRLPLPKELRYGCCVDVQSFQDGQVLIASKLIRVKPVDRMLTIETRTKDVYGPGEKVRLDVQVNRKVPVDLVVSVYDQSLLGVAADRSVDVRNFYLADLRVRQEQAREILRRLTGDVTVGELLKRAEKLLRERKELAATPEGHALTALLNRAKANGYIYTADLVSLFQLAGIDARLNQAYYSYYGANWYRNAQLRGSLADTRLADLLAQTVNGWRIDYRLVGTTLVLHETHPSWRLGPPVFLGNMYQNNLQQLNQWGQLQRRRGFARGDARFSATANSMYSASGQSFISHLPSGGPPVPLIDADSDQGHILVRRDFSDSAFWKADVRTDDAGKARVEFKLPDSLTNWQVVVTAISRDMHVGQHKARFRTYKPIMVWPMLPRVFTEGDQVRIFASVHNRTDQARSLRVKLKVDNGSILSAVEQAVDVPAKGNAPVYWTFRAGAAGYTQILMTAECAAGSDASLKRLPVVRAGAEQVVTRSGFCKGPATVTVPKGVDLGTSALEITFAPSLAADLADTLDYLVDYPYGCVEQTMSRFLPAIKVAQILKKFHIEHPGLAKRLPGCVAGGIKRLLELQQPDGGWGWHGTGQTHEMMTPYALYGLLQAEKAGYPIPSETAVQRGLARLKLFIDQMGPAQAADRIFCMYVYAHRFDIPADWWKFIDVQLDGKLSDYALALALEMAVQKGKKDLARALAGRLHARAQQVGGHVFWRTAGFSRWGDDRFEITAVALKALVAHDANDKLIPGVLSFFAATKRGKQWNSTKDTAMIVFALCDYLARQNFQPDGRHSATFKVNGGPATAVVFDRQGLAKKVVVEGRRLKAGANTITFAGATPGMMYRAVFRYWKPGRDLAPVDNGLKVTRRFYLLDEKGKRQREVKAGESVPRGSYLESEVEAVNAVAPQMRYVLVENPRPSCCEVQPVQDRRFAQACTPYVLREEKTAAVVFHHELTPATLQDRCVLRAELSGEYLVAPAVVEMMYQTETRGHSGSFFFKVVDPGT